MPLLVHTWDLPFTKADMEWYQDRGGEWVPMVLRQPGVIEFRAYRNPTGSSPQVKGAINSTLSFVKSSTYLTVRCALEHDVPNNAGVYRCITVTAPEGSILNPRMPAAVAARALTGYRVVDTVMGALVQIAPQKLMAAGEGGNTVVAIGGYQNGRPFILVDMNTAAR